MAFGLSPRHVRELAFGSVTRSQILVLAIEAAKKLEWEVAYVSESGFRAYTKFSMQVTFKIGDSSAEIRSECNGNQLMDWGKNKENVEALVREIKAQKESLTEEVVTSKFEEIRSAFSAQDDDPLANPPTTANEKMSGVLALFKPGL